MSNEGYVGSARIRAPGSLMFSSKEQRPQTSKEKMVPLGYLGPRGTKGYVVYVGVWISPKINGCLHKANSSSYTAIRAIKHQRVRLQ